MLFFGGIMSFQCDELLINIKRQAKRLAKIMNSSLGHAQETLAICVYGCRNYGELISLVKSQDFKNSIFFLTALHPKAETFLYKILSENITNISERFVANQIGFDKSHEKILMIFSIELDDFERKIAT